MVLPVMVQAVDMRTQHWLTYTVAMDRYKMENTAIATTEKG
jgi:hypothetical protein